MKKLEAQKQIIDITQGLCQERLITGTSGNISCRFEDGFLITPSAIDYSELTPEMIVFVKLGEESPDLQKETKYKPSSEWRIHMDLYTSEQTTNAVIHTHSTYCTTLACSHRKIPAFHYMVAIAGGNKIPCANYATFGSQKLSENILSAIDGYKACLMANHGAVFTGGNLKSAADLATEIELLAKQYCELLKIGGINIIDDNEMEKVISQFSSYKAS